MPDGREVGLSMLLAGDRGAARLAREAVGALPIDASMRHDVALVVSELVDNAVRHSGTGPGGRVGLRVSGEAASLRVEVRDAGRGRPEPREVSSAASGGRGLLVVSGIARRWGVVAEPHGTVVWADLEGDGHSGEMRAEGGGR
ncbi:MAG: ATP-binding protein [Thermoleophilia bacterium]|nr:ATP-binding protein [Thermoleophilia bacterium]